MLYFFYLVLSAKSNNPDFALNTLIFQIIFPFILCFPIILIYKFIMKQNQKFIKVIFYFFSFLMIAFHGILLISHFNLQQSPKHEVTELKKPNTLLLSTIKKENYTIDGKFFKSVKLIVDKEVQLYEDYHEKSFEEYVQLKLPEHPDFDRIYDSFARLFVDNYYLDLGNYSSSGSCSNDVYQNYLNKLKEELNENKL